MTESILFSAGAILPILLICLLGYLLTKSSSFGEDFFDFLHKLVYRAALPALVFLQIYEMDWQTAPQIDYLLFCVVAMILCYSLGLLICALTIRNRRTAGAMAQGMTRSTFSIVGLPLAEGLFGQVGLTTATLLLPPAVILNNAFAVLMLTVLSERHGQGGARKTARSVLVGILTNPLILGMLLAFFVRALSISLPAFVVSGVRDFSAIAQPLALLCLGAGFAKGRSRTRLGLASLAAVVKTVVLPLIFCSLAILFSFRGVQLGVVCILFGGPTTISSYIMAKNMDSDASLAGQIVLLSTVASVFTLFVAFFLLHATGLL